MADELRKVISSLENLIEVTEGLIHDLTDFETIEREIKKAGAAAVKQKLLSQ